MCTLLETVVLLVPSVVLALVILLFGLARGDVPDVLSALPDTCVDCGVTLCALLVGLLAAGEVWYFPSFFVDLGDAVLLLRMEVEKLFPLLPELRELLW